MAEVTTEKIGRRDAIKVIAASAGAISASAFLPEKWVKPVAEFGVSPAHAQASMAPTEVGTISGLIYRCENTGNPINFATVTVVGTGRTMTTSATGLYTFTNVPIGDYMINVSVVGPASPQTLGPVTVTVGGTVTQDFNFNDVC